MLVLFVVERFICFDRNIFCKRVHCSSSNTVTTANWIQLTVVRNLTTVTLQSYLLSCSCKVFSADMFLDALNKYGRWWAITVAQKVTFFHCIVRPTVQTLSHEKLLMDSLSCETHSWCVTPWMLEKDLWAQPEISFQISGVKSLATTDADMKVCEFAQNRLSGSIL